MTIEELLKKIEELKTDKDNLAFVLKHDIKSITLHLDTDNCRISIKPIKEIEDILVRKYAEVCAELHKLEGKKEELEKLLGEENELY